MVSMVQILKLAKEKAASDIHITAFSPPCLRINGRICKINVPPLQPEDAKRLCYSVVSDEQKAKLEAAKNLDFSFYMRGLCRVRGALFFQKAAVSGAFRLLNSSPPSFESLDLPPTMDDISSYPHGLVLVTGPTGSGKSTTLSACIQKINSDRSSHIITLEDPIEIVYQHDQSIITQREVGSDCHSFADGLKSAMRSDPDVCMIGEIRDRETVELTLKLAETGHLVFSSLHTNTASKSIDRILSMFDQQNRVMIQNQLSTVLQAVVSQRLAVSKDGSRRHLVIEILLANPAVRNLIRENKIYQIDSVMQTNLSEGMITLNHSLVRLVKEGAIERAEALKLTAAKDELMRSLSGGRGRRIAS